jgi:hypothetical protein
LQNRPDHSKKGKTLNIVKIAGSRLFILAVIVILAALLISTVVWPEVQYRRALPKYKIGVSAEQIERQYGIHLELRKNGNYLADGEDDYQKRRHYSYDAYVPYDFVYIDFNDFHEVLKVTKTTPIAKLKRSLGIRDP